MSEGNILKITLNTKLSEIAAYYGDPSQTHPIYDNLDAIGEDLIDISVVGQDWGGALDRVLRERGDDATVRDLRDSLQEM